MKSFIERARKIHRNQKGFTLIELMVVMVILAIIVGLVVPNFFGITDGADAIQIVGQHEKMREAVYLYNYDTSEWPTEWSAGGIVTANTTDRGDHQLWGNWKNDGSDNVTGWDGPYIDRPILQENRWNGFWGVNQTVAMNIGGVVSNYTVLTYEGVPLTVRTEVDSIMDDGNATEGAVQHDAARIIIIIAKE